MRTFFDTSVLVAAFYAEHIHHPASHAALLRCTRRDGAMGAHSLAEVFATLTGMPGAARVRPDTALLFLRNLEERLTLVALSSDEYLPAIEATLAWGISGKATYDALLAQCALKIRADVICTWDLSDYSRFGPEVADKLKRPDQIV